MGGGDESMDNVGAVPLGGTAKHCRALKDVDERDRHGTDPLVREILQGLLERARRVQDGIIVQRKHDFGLRHLDAAIPLKTRTTPIRAPAIDDICKLAPHHVTCPVLGSIVHHDDSGGNRLPSCSLQGDPHGVLAVARREDDGCFAWHRASPAA
jgi:hypothetical protein